MSVRVRFPSEAHNPSWKLFLEGFLFLCHISARQIRTFEQKKVWQRKEQKLNLSKLHKHLSVLQGLPIPLELHHKNGNNRDNRLENIVLLCPNCHALTESYRGKNKRQG